ncbi:MAG TPA: hypothetical protein PKH69_02150 [Thiobacillaceae bacterium]|nr:hypothetical protein [Thiobacillaceae bacterium]HNU62888.1 hypothetical protein [Thiobacillaceae bacterium]
MNTLRTAKFPTPGLLLGWSLSIAAVISLAIVAGFAASTGSLFNTGVVVALLCSIFLVLVPIPLLWFVVIGSTTVAGLTGLYLPQAGPIRWAFVIAAVFLGLAAVIRYMIDAMNAPRGKPGQPNPILFWALLYFSIVAVSTLYNDGLSFDIIVGLKNHFQVWGILLAFMFVPMSLRHANAFLYYLVFLGFIQIIPVLHQYLFLTQQRTGLTQVDVVVGTFVGSKYGGGANALLAMVQVICIAILAGFWRRRKIGGWATLAVSVFLLIPTMLNEAKIVLIALPLALGVVFWDYLKHRIGVLLGFAILIIPVLLGILWGQAEIMRQHNQGANRDLESFIQNTIDYNIGDRGHGRYILNRTTVYPFWWSEHGMRNLLQTFVGHGAASSKDSGTGLSVRTLASTRYLGYGVGLTGVSALLWETGVLGLAATIGLFVSAFRLAGRLMEHYRGTQTGMNIRAARAGIAVFAFSLLHNQSFVFELSYQAVLMLLLGYVVAVSRLSHTVSRPDAKPADTRHSRRMETRAAPKEDLS